MVDTERPSVVPMRERASREGSGCSLHGDTSSGDGPHTSPGAPTLGPRADVMHGHTRRASGKKKQKGPDPLWNRASVRQSDEEGLCQAVSSPGDRRIEAAMGSTAATTTQRTTAASLNDGRARQAGVDRWNSTVVFR